MHHRTTLGIATILSAMVALQTPATAEVLPNLHYVALDHQVTVDTNEKVEVAEIFSYKCPHCYHLEPALDKWLAKRKDDIHFVTIPAVFGDQDILPARAHYAAAALGKESAYRHALFDLVHRQRKSWKNMETLYTAAEMAGLERSEFKKALDSFTVQMQARRAQQLIEDFAITAVPSIVVAGKYRTSTAYAEGKHERLFEIVDDLIAKEEKSKSKHAKLD